MIVVDTNLLLYYFLPSDSYGAVLKVLKRDPEWIAPPLWRSEFRNVLATQMRLSKLSLDMAYQTMALAEEWMLNKEAQAASMKVLVLAAQSGCSAYDCEFVALAQHLGVPLVTSDKAVLRAFPKTAVNLQGFGA